MEWAGGNESDIAPVSKRLDLSGITELPANDTAFVAESSALASTVSQSSEESATEEDCDDGDAGDVTSHSDGRAGARKSIVARVLHGMKVLQRKKVVKPSKAAKGSVREERTAAVTPAVCQRLCQVLKDVDTRLDALRQGVAASYRDAGSQRKALETHM